MDLAEYVTFDVAFVAASLELGLTHSKKWLAEGMLPLSYYFEI